MTPGQIALWVLVAASVAAVVVYRQPVLAMGLKTRGYLRSVRAEIRKVTWPGWDELKRSTIVIVIFVIIIGIIIGVMDWVFTKILIDGLGRLFG